MATRVYLTRLSPVRLPLTPTSWSTGWNKATSNNIETASLSKRGIAPSSAGDTGVGVSGQYTAAIRFVMDRPLSAQTITGTVKGQVTCFETAAGDNYTLAVAIKVVKPDGTDRGILLAVSASDDTSATPPEMATTATNRRLLDVTENASLSLSSLSVSDGDYLVIELGFRQASTSTNTGAIDRGTAASDLAEDDTSVPGNSVWVEFSNTLTFVPTYYWDSSAAVPPDNDATGVADAATSTIVPPTGMLAGDLAVVVAQVSDNSDSVTNANAVGQTWTKSHFTGSNDQSVTYFWTTFNGGYVGSASFAGSDYMTRGAGLTGAADSKSGIFSVWYHRNTTNVFKYFLVGTTVVGGGVARFYVYIDSSNELHILGKNAAGTTIMDFYTTLPLVRQWVHLLISWDLNTAGARSIYINGVAYPITETTFTNDTIDYTLAEWGVAGFPDGSGAEWDGNLAELYFQGGEYLDFSIESNRRKFITADGRAANLGSNGSTPTGTQPIVYQRKLLSAAASTFATNLGSGGNFTITGSLTNGSNVPFSGWSENPTFTCAALSGTQPFSVIMHVWRPPSTSYRWEVDQAFTGANFSAPGSPFTVTVTGQTTSAPNTVTLATWASNDDNTYDTLAGTGWSSIGPAQQRNLAGADQSMTWAQYVASLPQVDAADFDGTNDYMTRGAGLTGAADSKSGIFSCWYRFDNPSGACYLLGSATAAGGSSYRFFVNCVGGQFEIRGYNAAGSSILSLQSNNVSRVITSWCHLLISWDLNTGGARKLFVSDIDETNQVTFINDTIDYTLGDWSIGGLPDGAGRLDSAFAELYFAPGQYLDFSTVANRRKFITADGLPVFLGATGTGPTGTAPLVYQSISNGEAVANFATNKGTGGNFTITGTLDPATAWSWRNGTFGGRFTENVSKNQATLGGDAGATAIETFKAMGQSLLPNVPLMNMIPLLTR